MAANGDQEPPKLQRVFWAITEGATATALLAAGNEIFTINNKKYFVSHLVFVERSVHFILDFKPPVGGKNSLLALQSVSICAALPFTIILCYVCLALWRACAMEVRPQYG